MVNMRSMIILAHFSWQVPREGEGWSCPWYFARDGEFVCLHVVAVTGSTSALSSAGVLTPRPATAHCTPDTGRTPWRPSTSSDIWQLLLCSGQCKPTPTHTSTGAIVFIIWPWFVKFFPFWISYQSINQTWKVIKKNCVMHNFFLLRKKEKMEKSK